MSQPPKMLIAKFTAVSDFKKLDCSLFQTLEIWYPILFGLLLGSLMSYRKVFVLQIELQIPPSSILVARKLSKIGCTVFFYVLYCLLFMRTKNDTLFITWFSIFIFGFFYLGLYNKKWRKTNFAYLSTFLAPKSRI